MKATDLDSDGIMVFIRVVTGAYQTSSPQVMRVKIII